MENPSDMSERPVRSRTLTEKGLTLYENTRDAHCAKLDSVWQDIKTTFENGSKKFSGSLGLLRRSEKELTQKSERFRDHSYDYMAFLARSGTVESQKDMDAHLARKQEVQEFVIDSAEHFNHSIEEMLERITHLSQNSEHSRKTAITNNSDLSSVIAKKLAEAESARVGLDFVKKQADVLKRRAEMEADLKLLEQEKLIAMADAEVRVLQAVGEHCDTSRHSLHPISVPADDPRERTNRYVTMHSNNDQVQPNVELPRRSNQFSIGNHESSPAQILNPDAPAFQPGSEFARFLLKKDLLLSRLRTFSDQPEAYAIWKTGFISVMDELHVSAIEEMDLLAKWLGTESTRHALSLRSANVHNPGRGLQRIWERLDERYGCPEMVEASLKARLNNFPKLTSKDNRKLYELSDLLSEVESVKCDEKYGSLLSYFDSSSGVIPIVSKLPYNLQERWTTHAFRYKQRHSVPFPPFSVFVEFVRETSKMRNDPSFQCDGAMASYSMPQKKEKPFPNPRFSVLAKKTEVLPDQRQITRAGNQDVRCPIHQTKHSLNDCKGFKAMLFQERKDFLFKRGICFKCCQSTDHMAKACTETVKCAHCGKNHATALHIVPTYKERIVSPETNDGVDKWCNTPIQSPVASKCTQICGETKETFHGKSCAKIILVRIYPKGHPEQSVKTYAILDDQSNVSLARSELFELLNIQGGSVPYTLSSCAGVVETSGRRASDLVVESLDSSCKLDLSSLIECNQIPNLREEIPTPEVAFYHTHLNDIAQHIQPVDNDAEILLLIGRDMTQAHHVHDQRIRPGRSPYAQRLGLGWVIVGETCLGKVHKPDTVNVNKTHTLSDGRRSIFKPCPNAFHAKKDPEANVTFPDLQAQYEANNMTNSVFELDKDDDKQGTSVEDRKFLEIMDRDMSKNPQGTWVAPLPFRLPKTVLPNNRPQALKRAKSLDRTLQRDPVKRKHMVEFMQKILESNHAEVADSMEEGEECWFLPLFGVYHPKKPTQIRVVFDSSAVYSGISLNNALLQGPDLVNNLLGVLLRFRREAVAVMADIQQMFHCFSVREDHRNFLRFLWYRDNNPSLELIEYRMCVHVFGNRPSPAVAAYGLMRTAKDGETEFGVDMRQFVDGDFYVDDGLASLPTVTQAIDLMKRSQKALKKYGNLRLHKIVSNSLEVMQAFASDDRAKGLRDLDLGGDTFPLQRCLGMAWNINTDTFTFTVSLGDKPFTKRGILSTINSLFDPMGIAAPVVIKGKLLLRDLILKKVAWDDPLPREYQEEWDKWKNSLKLMERLHIPRTLVPTSFQDAEKKEIHVFSDASEKAIAAVAYLKTVDKEGRTNVGFVLGKAKVAPAHGHTIPRLELCAAVMATDVANQVTDHLDLSQDAVCYHTDSKIVLGYIGNQTRRFSVYVANRVARIRNSSEPKQWTYVSTNVNPADCATRSIPASELDSSLWLLGPTLQDVTEGPNDVSFPLVNPTIDKEVRPEVAVCATHVKNIPGRLGSQRFERFSVWRRLVKVVARLKRLAVTRHDSDLGKQKQSFTGCVTVAAYSEAETFIIKEVQHEVYRQEILCLASMHPLPKESNIVNLNPRIDDNGLLRVGGRLNYAEMDIEHKNPIILPGKHHVAKLLVRHYHEQVKHQGRHLTEGAVRSAGLWITGCKRLISSLIYNCVQCRKLRGKEERQLMADLPSDRLKPSPPFTYVGVDVFGPWSVVTRRTRGGQASGKRWALLCTCLVTRAIHIEVIEDMSSSSFINALRRFIAIRGKVCQFRSDRGTNFIGSTDILNVRAINVEDQSVVRYLSDNRSEWIFNPPHSSHMGGAWERMIGITRRILDSMMADASTKTLTHEVLSTFLAEVCAIVNGRPIVPVSSDPDFPLILSPATLLTQKVDHVTEPMGGECSIADMYKAQWKRVQILAETFWSRWKKEYLHLLQTRRKWQHDRPCLEPGDVVLLKEKHNHRNDWPTAVVDSVIPSGDGLVRKAVVSFVKEGKRCKYTRPITEMIVLLSKH